MVVGTLRVPTTMHRIGVKLLQQGIVVLNHFNKEARLQSAPTTGWGC